MSQERPVLTLNEDIARKIAAGEVIERPASVVRELLDNAVDSGATSITLSLSGGGIDEIRVTDNGSGMTKADLEIAGTPHATSKIRTERDLMEIRSLGFRGEALSSMQAVARLEIVSATETPPAWRLVSGPGLGRTVSPCHGNKGTSVTVSSLFHAYPARKQFLKTSRSESLLCQRTFEEKAEARPDIAFTLIQDGTVKKSAPVQSLRDRVLLFSKPEEPETWFDEVKGAGDGFSLRIIAGNSEVIRRDRSDCAIFVNGRKIQEYGLLQAVEYGYSGFLPGGQHPFAYTFIDVDPELVDFNIHPAKKEARFKAIQRLRDSIIANLKSSLSGRPHSGVTAAERVFSFAEPSRAFNFSYPEAEVRPENGSSFRERDDRPETNYETRKLPDGARGHGEGFVYRGRAFGCFLLAEKDDELWLVDQHAAHERIIFDRLSGEGCPSQDLLVPIILETDGKGQDDILSSNESALTRAGFRIERLGKGSWSMDAVPSIIHHPEALVERLLETLASGHEFEKLLWADIACKAAVKDGDILEDGAARDLIDKAFSLKERQCPHGRPVMFALTKNEAFARVRRTIF